MGLTSLLKKKKSRGENLSSLSSGIQSNKACSSSVSGTSVDALPMSLNIRTDNQNLSVPSGEPLSLSLMDDIMDELAGTTPDTPQPKQRLPKDFTDLGLSFELSRQLDLGTSESADTPSASSRPSSSGDAPNSTNPNTASSVSNGPIKSVGKLGQNSAFKDNAFLRSQQQQQQQQQQQKFTTATTTTKGVSNNNNNNNNNSTTSSSLLRGSILSKEAEEKAEAAAKLREASKKANAQLPSDDEGSDSSEAENSDDEELSPRKQRQLQQRLLQQQQQAALQQQLEEQQLRDLDGNGIDPMITKSRRGSVSSWPPKPVEVNHEAVIDRMKDRHRAVLAGAQAAAMDDYYEEYMDEYGRMHPQQQPMQQPGPLAYNMQYGMDPNMMYTMDDFRFQPQQMYYNQSIPSHNMANVMPYGHQGMNSLSGYMYNMPPTVPIGAGYPMMQGGPFPGLMGPLAHFHGQSRDQGSTASSEVSGPTMGHIDLNASPRRSSRQQSTTSSSARISEDSWGTEPYHISSMSTQKTLLSDSGYGGNGDSTSDLPLDNSQEDLRSQEFECDKASAKSDDVTKVVQVLSVGQVESEENHVPSPPNSITEDDPESLKDGDTTLLGSLTDAKDSSVPSTSSIAQSAQDENEEESSDDDDQPIILSRRGSARGQILPPKLNTFISSNGVEYPEDAMITPVSNVSYLAHGMYQPIQGPTNIPSHMAYTPQQQPSAYGSSIPMGYQFPSPPVVSAAMGHQHSYSIDRVMPVSGGPGQTGMNGNAVGGGGPMMVRRPVAVPNGGYIQSAGPKQGMVGSGGNGNINNTASGSPVLSPYPIPPTTLLHPGPRRSQSMRVRPQPQKSTMRMDVTPRQAQQQQQQQNQPLSQQSNQQQQQQLLLQQQQQQQQAASRSRASMDYVRLPNGGYQPAMEYNGGNFLQQQSQQNYVMQQHQIMGSPQQSHAFIDKQQLQQQQQQQQQQGYYTGHAQGFGYLPNDPYMAHPHQQMYATRR